MTLKEKIECVGHENFTGIEVGKPFYYEGELIGYPFNLSDLLNQYGKRFIPNELGIYHLFYYDQLVYIGMSKSLQGRLLQHHRDSDMVFNRVLWFCSKNWKEDATIADTLRIEYEMIHYYKPVLNTRGNCSY